MTGLKHEPAADELSGDWQPLLDSLGQRVEEVQLTAGQRLFSQRDVSDALYILLSGELAVRARPRGSNLEQVIARIRPGELVGEIGWLSGTRRSASVDAVGEAKLKRLGTELLSELRDGKHPVLDRISAVLDQRKRLDQRRLQGAPVVDALTQWWSRRDVEARDVDVVLLNHPRHAQDLRVALPWLRGLDDAELEEVSCWLRPVFCEVLQIPKISVGMLFLPRMAAHLMDPRRRAESRRLMNQDCVSLARNNRVRVMCLGGLSASLMRYGRLFEDTGELRITTGHAMTSICCVRTLEAAIERFNLEPEAGQLTVLGVGSVGSAFTELLLTRERRPGCIVLSDLPAQMSRVRELAERLRPMLPSGVQLELVEAEERLSAEHPAYHSTFLFSATSSANIIDINKVAAGTVLIDDSQPHCWSRPEAWQRYSSRGDIYPCEAGLVDCDSIGYRSFFPYDFLENPQVGTSHAWCCLTEGLLLGRDPDLQPTIGEPTLESMLAYDRAFVKAKLCPAPLRCGPNLL